MINKSVTCAKCEGKKYVIGNRLGGRKALRMCPYCRGTGKFENPIWKKICPVCEGAGRTFPDAMNPEKPHGKCKRCHGKGTVLNFSFKK